MKINSQFEVVADNPYVRTTPRKEWDGGHSVYLHGFPAVKKPKSYFKTMHYSKSSWSYASFLNDMTGGSDWSSLQFETLQPRPGFFDTGSAWSRVVDAMDHLDRSEARHGYGLSGEKLQSMLGFNEAPMNFNYMTKQEPNMTDETKTPEQTLTKSFTPTCADECSMENLVNYGFSSGPCPEQPKVRPPEIARPFE